jgi:hypothetical protein
VDHEDRLEVPAGCNGGGAQADGGEAFALFLDPLTALAAYGARNPGFHGQIRIRWVDDRVDGQTSDVAFNHVDFGWHF